MTPLRTIFLAASLLAVVAVPARAATTRCSLEPGKTQAVVRIELDTTLAHAPGGGEATSFSGVRPSPNDSLLATPTTPMPAARVRILQLDSATRAVLAQNGIRDLEPTAFLRAAPYRADCRIIRWTDTVPFVRRGDVGYVRGYLAPREGWVSGVPVIVIAETWDYPYPHRRSLAYGVAPTVPLAPADALFSINTALEMPDPASEEARIAAQRMKRSRAMAWARANVVAAEAEPVRTMLRSAILDADWEEAASAPSRLRGTYRVDIDAGGERSTWFFRTHDRPGYAWNGGNPSQPTSALLASPHIAGYLIVGYAARWRDSLVTAAPRTMPQPPAVWISSTDRPTAPGNSSRTELRAVLEFTLAAAPEAMWSDLETRLRPISASEADWLARTNRTIPRGERQPQLPITIRLDSRGGVRADTTLRVGARSIRVVLERVDTVAVKQPW